MVVNPRIAVMSRPIHQPHPEPDIESVIVRTVITWNWSVVIAAIKLALAKIAIFHFLVIKVAPEIAFAIAAGRCRGLLSWALLGL